MERIKKDIVDILENIKDYIQGKNTDVTWSSFESEEDVIVTNNNHILKLRNNEFSKIDELYLLFLPTSDLQEISISSGWGKEFLVIAEKFDNAIKDLMKKIK